MRFQTAATPIPARGEEKQSQEARRNPALIVCRASFGAVEPHANVARLMFPHNSILQVAATLAGRLRGGRLPSAGEPGARGENTDGTESRRPTDTVVARNTAWAFPGGS